MCNGITNWKTFVEAGRTFLDANWGSPMYQLIETLDELYRVAYSTGAFPQTGTELNDFVHMCFLLCHRSLLSAATATGSGQPEDGVAISRRALEAAKTCLAVKIDPSNYEVWIAAEARIKRWENRTQGGSLKNLELKYKHVYVEPLYKDLRATMGAMSDFAVHFTPEHVGQYEWQEGEQKDGATERSFRVGEKAVTGELLMLAGQHRLIIRVFDRCLDGKLLPQPTVTNLAQRALAQYKNMLQREGFAKEAVNVGDTW